MIPRILVTTSRGTGAEEYLDALREAGAEPVRIDTLDASVATLDDAHGLLLTGGADVDPAWYGAAASPLVGEIDRDRDGLEIALLREARERETPTFCICRGLQVANVAFGGTLIVDIPEALGANATIPHRVRRADGKTERGLLDEHRVQIDPQSVLARIVGTAELVTGSRHHQSADRCAADLRVTARTGDGIVEALEARFASPFWLAVQWHPESTRDLDGGASRALFRAFADAARVRAISPREETA
jgi:putative glutamine amidotransferase